MLDAFEMRSHAMPAEMLVLLEAYPREMWADHPGFKEKTKNWLGAHNMFRHLGEIIRMKTGSCHVIIASISSRKGYT